jgi:GAF domain-containing protein
MSATPDSTLANPEQRIADLERQLAEYRAERDEALAERAATAEILQIINSSPGDLTSVFNAILEKAHTLCGIAFGSLLIREGAEFCVVAAREKDNDPSGGSRYIKVRREQDRFRPPEGTPLWRVSEGARLVHLSDATADDSYYHAPAYARLIDAGGVRTLLLVPLRKDDELLGAITAFRREVRPFSEKEIGLLQNFAAQAVIAMENARLITETREALEQQAATAEVLGVINSSPGDLVPVFDAILEKATQLCEAPFGVLRTWDGERFHVIAAQGDPEFTEWARGYGPFAPADPSSPAGRIVSGEEVVRFADAPEGEALSISAGFRALVEASGMRSGVIVALRKDGALRGNVTVFRREVRPFTEKQIALLQNFAAQAVIAMENARLLTETREALDQQTATAEVLQVINSSPGDLAPVFDAMLEKALHMCVAAYGSMHAWDGEAFPIVALRGVPPALVEVFRERELFKPTPGNVAERIAAGETVIRATDLREEPHYLAGARPARAIVELGAGRSYACIALRKDNALLGALTMWRTEIRPFTDKQIALLQSFAAQAVIAMENARLLGELRERTHQLEQSLEYQTATSDVLQVISRSTFDLKPVLDTVIHTAARLCQAEVGHIATRDGDVYRPLAGFGVSPTEREALIRTRVFNADNTTFVGRAVSEGKVIHVADVQTEPAYASSPVVVRSTVSEPFSQCRCCAWENRSASFHSDAGGSSRSRTARSNWCAPSPTRRSSRWRTRACSASCGNGRMR